MFSFVTVVVIKIFENILYEIFFIKMFAVSDIIVTFASSFSLAEPTLEARAEPNLFELCLARRRKSRRLNSPKGKSRRTHT